MPAVQSTKFGHTVGSQASLTLASLTVAAGTDRGIVVLVATWGNETPRATWNGVDLVLDFSEVRGSYEMHVFVYPGEPPTATSDLVIYAPSNTWIAAGAYAVDGFPGLLGVPTCANATSTTPSVSVPSATGHLVLDLVVSTANNQTFTVGAGQTSLFEEDSVATTDVRGAGSSEAGAASVTMSWTLGTSNAWAIIGVSLADTGEPSSRLSHLVTEVLEDGDGDLAPGTLTHVNAEVLENADADLAVGWVTQVFAEVLEDATTPDPAEGYLSQVFAEVLYDNYGPIPPGGGGGEGPEGVNPTPGIVPSNVPEVFAVFTLDGVDYPFGVGQLNDDPTWYGGQKNSKIKDISSIKYQLTKEGGPQAVSFTVTVFDGDRVFLNRAGTTDQIKGGFCAVYVIDHDDRIAELTPKRIGAGYITKYEGKDDFTFTFTVKDALSTYIAKIDKEAILPQGRFNLTDFPSLDPSAEGKAIPLILGRVTDEDKLVVQGDVPMIYVATINLNAIPGGGGAGPNIWVDAYIWAQGAFVNNGITAVYYNDPTTPLVRSIVPFSAYGTIVWTPFHPGWTAGTGLSTMYVDYNGRRYTPFLIKADITQAPLVKQGNILVAANIYGTEHVGDTTGNMIDSPPYITTHVINNYVFNNYKIGAYPAIPTYEHDTITPYSWIDTDTFDEVHQYFIDRLSPGGYVCGTILGADGQAQTVSQFLQDMCTGVWMDIGINLDGQLIASVFNPDDPAVATFDAISHIENRSYTVSVNEQRLVNRVEHEYAKYYIAPYAPSPTAAEGSPQPSTPTPDYPPYRSGVQVNEDLGNQALTGEVATFVIQNQVVRNSEVATDVSLRILEEGRGPTGYGPHEFSLRGGWDLIGSNVRLGKNIYVKHPAKFGSGARDLCRVTSIDIFPLTHRVVLGGDVIDHE